MWICLNNAFVSAVQHRDKPDCLMVRARRREHLEAVFPKSVVVNTPDGDYHWRVTVDKITFKRALLEQVDRIDYDNFKNSVECEQLHASYSSVWGVMHRLQYLDEPQEITAMDESFLDSGRGRASPYDWREIDSDQPVVLD